MIIHEISELTGVPVKTIRYYESLGLLPPPERAANNYRQYNATAIERLRFIASARSMGFSLANITQIIVARQNGGLRCGEVLDTIDQRLADIDRRIADLLVLRETLGNIRSQGESLPRDNTCDEQCACYLITTHQEHGQIDIQLEEK